MGIPRAGYVDRDQKGVIIMGWFGASDSKKRECADQLITMVTEGKITKGKAPQFGLNRDDWREVQGMAVKQVLNMVTADGVVDNRELELARSLLEVCDDITDEQNRAIHKFIGDYYRIYVMSTSGKLLPIAREEASFVLKKGELVYYWGEANFMKKRKQTKRVNYHGPVASIKICKGVRYRIGSVAPSFETSEFWEAADSGHFFITSQRIGFIGPAKNFTVQIPKLFNICMGDGGLNIFKEGRENPWVVKLDAGNTPELPLFIIDSLLNGIEPINTQG